MVGKLMGQITLPRIYSVYMRVVSHDGVSDWVGVHRLPIASALRYRRALRDCGYRVVMIPDGERGPGYTH